VTTIDMGRPKAAGRATAADKKQMAELEEKSLNFGRDPGERARSTRELGPRLGRQ
jgi:hypothetical protein